MSELDEAWALALAKAARAFYGHSDLRMRLGAVTGSNEKEPVKLIRRAPSVRSARPVAKAMTVIRFDIFLTRKMASYV